MPLHERDIHYFTDVTVAYLNKITNGEIVPRDSTIEFQSLVFSAYTGLLHLKGNTEGFAYITTSQQFLHNLFASRHKMGRFTEETCRDLMHEITGALAHSLQRKFAPALDVSEPRIFSTVPDDPIEMPPAVFVQPLLWRKELTYLVLGLSTPEPG